MAVNYIPYNLGEVFVAMTSGKRYMNFVGSNDVEKYTQVSQNETVILDGNFKWHNQCFQLKNINVTFKKGQLIVIVGGNGSGKTSLLYVILGELQKISGQVLQMEGTYSLASQEPFVKQGTIMENIVCDEEFDMTRYLKVMEITQLQEDISRMPNGHNTQVGEHGQALSGGQRKRLNIARALYRKSEILLLDCPFASLDHKTAQNMMDSLQQLKESQTIIITTNDLQYVNKCDQIIHLDNGQIIYDGILQNYKQSSIVQHQEIEKEQQQDIQESEDTQEFFEDRQIGVLDLGIFRQLYNLFGKHRTVIFVIVFCLLGMGVSMMYQLQLKSITEVSDSEDSTQEQKFAAVGKFLIVYPLCKVSMAIFALINGIFLTRKGVTASVKLHNNIVNNLLKASVTHYYNVTSGSVVKNRLTNDIFQFDTNTPQQISSLFSSTFNLIALSLACIVMSSALSYPILILYLVLQTRYTKKYIKINLEVSRLQAISKSPILNYVSEIHSGIAFYRHSKCKNLFYDLFNIYTRNSLCQAALYAWFLQITCFFMLIMYVCIIFVNVFQIIQQYLYKIDHKEAATISVYLAIAVGETFTGFAIQFQNFYSNNVYFERCLQLLNIPKEEDSQNYSEFQIPYQNMSEIEMMTVNSQPEEFQDELILEVNDLNLRYKNTQILSDISFKLTSGQKIAIVGRTGAGKTSLIHCITRLVDPYSGQIKVLGQENLSINKVRQLFSVVSQDPFVFEGTVQQNIDPNNQYTQFEISQLFNKYHLMDVGLLQELNFQIDPHGQNLSLGQKQLLVMCRILLQQRKIVILDECTGNLDSEYSKLINLTLDLYMKVFLPLKIRIKVLQLQHINQIYQICLNQSQQWKMEKQLQRVLDQLFCKNIYEIYNMLRNTHQSERRGSMLDEHFGLPKRSAANIPDTAASRSAQRRPSKIGSAIPSSSKIQRSPKSKLSMISRNDQRKSTINSNMSSNRRQEKLLNEYKDLFEDNFSSQSSSSSDKNSSRAAKVEPKNIDKVIDQEMEFIHNTLNQKMSTISKNNQTIRRSVNSQSRPLTKSMKSMKQLSQYSKLKSSSHIAAQSIKFRKESSISSFKDVQSSQDFHSLVKILDKAGVPEEEQQQYQQIIEEVEKQCLDMNPTSKPRIKQKVRKTFVNLLNQYYGDTQRKPDGDQQSQFSIAAHDSIQFNNNPRFRQDSHNQSILKGQSQINVTSIMENVFTKQSISERMKRFIEDIQINLDDESEPSEQEKDNDDENEILSEKSSYCDDTQEAEEKQEKKDLLEVIQQRFERRIKRDPIFDPYPLIWESEQDFSWALKDYNFYWDNYPLSGIRTLIVLILRLFSIVVNKIINHRFFRLCVLGSIIFNIAVFVQSQDDSNNENTQGDLREKKKIILYLFIGENALKLIGLGIFQFFFDLQNIFDMIILVLFLLHFNYPEVMVVDFSTARLFRLLLVMSAFSKRLQIMLLALKHSIKFLVEALVIVVIFSYFFALFSMHLFQGLFYYRCYYEDGIQTTEECGYNLHCHEEGMFCARSLNNPNIPTNFDDICYAYENIVRLMIFNEWTEPVYLAMQTFHDFTVVYFLLIAFIISIFCANLIIAVLKIYYSQTLEKYEFDEIEELETDVKIILNLRIIKNYEIDCDLKNNEQRFVRKNELEQTAKTTFIKTIVNPTKSSKKNKFLSARQVREFKEVQNRKRGIKAQKSNLDNLVENFTLSRIFLAEQNKDQFIQKILANEAFDKDYFKLFYIQTLKENPIYSWKTKINQNYDYKSTSEFEVFGAQRNQEQMRKKREREFEFIRKFTNKHYYVIKKSETSVQRSDTRRQTQDQQKNYPIRKKNRLKKTNSFQEMKQLDKIETLREKEPSLEKMLQIDLHKSLMRKISTAKTFKKTLLINDEECDAQEVMAIFLRNIPNTTIEIEDYEELFVKYRLEECQQGVIYKNNWSEVVTQSLQTKQKIFRTLNKREVNIWLTGLNGSFLLIQKYAVQILQNRSARMFFDFLVLANIVLLSCFGLVEDEYIRKTNDYLLFVLIGELVLKILQQGLRRFCSNFSNILDAIVLTSTLIQSLFVMQDSSYENIYLDLLNSFQAILIYRIIKYNKFAVKIANVTKKSLPSFFNLILLMITLMLMFAFVGMDLFKDKFPIDTPKGLQQSFNDLPAAFLTVFIRASNEDWIGLVVLGSTYSYKVATMFYGVIFVYVLNFMTIGFILAIILDAFQAYAVNDNEDNDNYQIDTEISEDIENLNNVTLLTQVQKEQSNEPVIEDVDVVKSVTTMASQKNLSKGMQKILDKKFKLFNLFENINKLVEKLFKGFEFYTNNESEYALFIFSKKNIFRKFCYRLIHYSVYVHSIQIIFSLTLVHMSLQTYYDDKKLINLEIVLNITLLLDSMLKIVALGFMTEKGTFTSELWRFVDFVYQVSYAAQLMHYFEAFKYLRYIRYTRPFRFLYLFEELKYINNAITKSLADLINILFVQMMVWVIFAVFGVIIYREKMGYCEEPLNFGVNQIQCEEEGKEWINNLYNFDNIGNAMLTLYRTTACDDWVYIYEVCMNSGSPEQGPALYENKWVTYIYFILFILIGVLFFMGFFAGILFINFQTNRTKLSKQILTKDQQLFSDVTKMILVEIPNYSDPPNTTLRKGVSALVRHPIYEKLILLTILINTGILTFVYYEASNTELVELLYQIITCFLILDTFFKLLAFGITRYWGFIWRKIELILSMIALVDLVSYLSYDWTKYYYKSNIEDHYFILVRLGFALRNLRTLLIIQQFKGLTRLLRILNFSASFLFQILCFLLAIMLFYGFIGCEAFANITEGEIVTEYLNFNDIGKALLVLFKACTKNQWVAIMIDVSTKNEYCEHCGVDWYFASIYFYTYILISSFVAFNLFITALVDQFESTINIQLGFFHSQNSVLQTYIENIDPFRTTWCKYSTETKGLKMHSKHLANFLLELGPPLGALHGDNIWDAAKSASNFKIRADQEGYIHFQEVLYETIRFVYREQIFRTGSPESIQEIKQVDKDTRFRLHFKRVDILDRREPIFDRMYIKGNFNILQEYLFLLMIFRTLKTYSAKTILKIQNNILSPDSTQKQQFQYDSEESDKDYVLDNIKRCNTIEDEIYEIDLPKYNIAKTNKRLKFLDQSQDSLDENHVIYEPEGRGQMTNKLSMKGKSALKKQAQQQFNFVDFETMGQKQLHNPMLDSSHLNENSKSMMTDSLIDEEDKILTLRTMNRNIKPGCRFSISSSNDDVGTESHNYFKGKPKREGRNYLI